MDYEEYEKQVNIIKKQNEKYLELFQAQLSKDGLTKKTVNNHVSNIDFYINDYLNYYDPREMKEGCYVVDGFLGDWFIRKAMWANCAAIKSYCSSLKKFYKVMLDY